jgi:hypothetical protein
VSQVIVRVLAILMVLGLLAGALDARAVDTPATAALTVSIDEGEDAADLELVVPLITHDDAESRALAAQITSEVPPRYEHSLFVFRPPRAYAFN